MLKYNLDFLLSQPEGQYIEFKRSASVGMAKDIVAFANTGGGTIVIGVNDNGDLTGVTNSNRQRSQVESIARNCDPPVAIKIETEVLSGKTFLLVDSR